MTNEEEFYPDESKTPQNLSTPVGGYILTKDGVINRLKMQRNTEVERDKLPEVKKVQKYDFKKKFGSVILQKNEGKSFI